MTSTIVNQLISKTANEASSLESVLLLAKAVAAKLDSREISDWIDLELAGYPTGSDLPGYRVVHGSLVFRNPIHGIAPIHVKNDQLRVRLQTVHVSDSAVKLEQFARDGAEPKILTYTVPAKHYDEIAREFDDMERRLIVPFLKLDRIDVVAILSQVRSKVLTWALQLDSSGIRGADMDFSDSEKHQGRLVQQFFYGSVFGAIGAANNSEVMIANRDVLREQIDVSSLRAELKAELLALVENVEKSTSDSEKVSGRRRLLQWLEDNAIEAGSLALAVAQWLWPAGRGTS